MLQNTFFKNYIKPFEDKKGRAIVIISDAFRYELAKELNYKLLELCAKHNIPFLNTQEVLKDSDGGLKKEYARNENQTPGVHLTKEGNNIAIEYFKNHAIEK